MKRIEIHGTIGEPEEEALREELKKAGIGQFVTHESFSKQMNEVQRGEDIEVDIKSIGGDVILGFEIADKLKRHAATGASVHTIGRQYDSIASIVFLSGTKRTHISGAAPVIHTSWRMPESLEDVRLDAQTLLLLAESHAESDEDLLNEYCRVAGEKHRSEIRELMKKETALSDEQVLKYNFATTVAQDGALSRIGGPLAFNNKAIKALSKPQTNYADLIAFDEEGQVLMIKRAKTEAVEPGKWAFPGGKIEQGETPQQTAVREFKEEVGLTPDAVEFVNTVKNPDGTLTFYFTAHASGEPFVREVEVGDAVYVDPETVEQMDCLFGQAERLQIQVNLSQSIMSKDIKEGLEKQATLLSKIAAKLDKVFSGKKAMTVTTAEGVELQVEGESLTAGQPAFVLGEDGQSVSAPAGTHQLSTGQSIEIDEDGVITEVKEAQATYTEEEMNAKIAEAVEASKSEMEAKLEEMAAGLEAANKEKEQMAAAGDELKAEMATLAADLKALNEAFVGSKSARTPGAKAQADAEDWSKLSIREKQLARAKAVVREINEETA